MVNPTCSQLPACSRKKRITLHMSIMTLHANVPSANKSAINHSSTEQKHLMEGIEVGLVSRKNALGPLFLSLLTLWLLLSNSPSRLLEEEEEVLRNAIPHALHPSSSCVW